MGSQLPHFRSENAKETAIQATSVGVISSATSETLEIPFLQVVLAPLLIAKTIATIQTMVLYHL